MWGRKRSTAQPAKPDDTPPGSLKDTLRRTRIEEAERSGVVVDLRDAELARLELLNDALDPLFAEIPADVTLFDRGLSRGDTPRLWLDAIAHVAMARDKRHYRFVQDNRYGRKVLAESTETRPIVEAVTHYVAMRLIERERALASVPAPPFAMSVGQVGLGARARRWRFVRAFLFGLVVGIASLFAALWIVAASLR